MFLSSPRYSEILDYHNIDDGLPADGGDLATDGQ